MTFRAWSAAFIHWSSAFRLAGRCSTGSAVRILGQVRELAFQVAQIVAANPQAVHINFDWIEPVRQVRVRIDQNEARLLGLSSQTLVSVLNTVISGTPITQVRDDIYLIDVVARATEEQRVSLDTLRTLQVPLPSGRTVPL